MTALIAKGIGIQGRLQPTDLDVRGGELVALVGPNGGGKTSLLRALARIESAAGDVAICGEDVDRSPMPRRRQLLSFLPASREVTWPISVRDVIELGLDRPDPDRVAELVALFELNELGDRPINCLSTGERTRVLTARAMAARSTVLLLDEPLSNLDPYWVLRFLEVFRGAAASGQAVLVALHDLGQLRHFDRALLIAEGSVQMDEAPDSLMASERFQQVYRIRSTDGGWVIRQPVGRQSSP
ncbi:MAG: ABC transporter ATP-binding protein [Sphingomicrobium sp.]